MPGALHACRIDEPEPVTRSPKSHLSSVALPDEREKNDVAKAIDCLRENIDADFARSLLVYGFSGLVTEEQPDVPASFAAQMGEVEATCGSA